MQITLWYAPISCSLVPYAALTEAGAHFDVRVVNIRDGEQMNAEYLKINPKHKVPVLVVDGQPLTENVAILQWIARQFPQSHLLPTGLDEFKAISLLAWCASGIHPHLTPNLIPQRYCDLPGSEDAVRRCAQRLLLENFAIAENMLREREWFFDGFTLPDIYFFWCFRRARIFNVDTSGLPNCGLHFNRVAARPSLASLLVFEADVLARVRP
ncbi:MAG TPA: glutathione S-transferase family protein [Steroidobacteraceae bacterium]